MADRYYYKTPARRTTGRLQNGPGVVGVLLTVVPVVALLVWLTGKVLDEIDRTLGQLPTSEPTSSRSNIAGMIDVASSLAESPLVAVGLIAVVTAVVVVWVFDR